MPFLRSVWLVLTFLLIILIAVPFLIIQEIIRLFSRKATRLMACFFLKYFIRIFMKLNMMQVTVVGKENIPADGRFVFMSNHQDQCDILLIYGYLDQAMGMVAKKELGFIPVIGRWMIQMECYLLDRKNPRQALNLFEKAAKNIQNGYPALIYPEGTRSLGPVNGPFLQGSMRLPLLAQAPIVPITLSGSWKPLHGNKKGVVPSKMVVTVGKPIELAGYEKSKDLALAVQQAVEKGFTDENKEDLKAHAYAAKYK